MSWVLGRVLAGFYRERAAARYTPKLGDFDYSLSFEDIFAACAQLAQQQLIAWNTIASPGGISFGTGHITPLGIAVVEKQTPPPISLVLPELSASAPLSGNLPDVSWALRELITALDRCPANADDITEARRRLSHLMSHPLMQAMNRDLV